MIQKDSDTGSYNDPVSEWTVGVP